MTEKEVRDIFAEELSDKPANKAIMAAHHRVGLRLLEKLNGRLLAGENGGILRENAYADSRICTFLAMENKPEIRITEEYFDDLLLLYRHWAKVLTFFQENYKKFKSAKFKRLWSPDDVLALKNLVDERYEGFMSKYLKTNGIDLCLIDFPFMRHTFMWLYYVLLGPTAFVLFLGEFNKALATLRKYQKELVPI